LKRLIVIAVLVVVAASVFWLIRWRLVAPPLPEETAEVQRVRTVTIYFGSPDGTSLIAEHRTVPSSDNVSDNIRTVIEALISGPHEGAVATLPASVRVRGVFLFEKTAVIDFSKELVDDFSGGTTAEFMLISSLVQTVCANFPEVESVRILVEGEEAETIGGHLSTARVLRPQEWR
jgi:germination protein M